jgi:sporulation protein YlmC with PRC-barrel domain
MSLPVRLVTTFLFTILSTGLLAFDQFEAFRENGKYGVINTETKEVVLKPEFEAVGWSDKSFLVFNNTIGVKRNEKWALASVDGSKITPHQYTVLYPFTDNLLIAGVRSSFTILDKLGVLTTRGKVTVGLQYDQLIPIGTQLIAGNLTQGEYRFGLLSKNGKLIIPQEHGQIKAIEHDILSVKNKDGFSAIFNTDGQQLSSFEFEKIEPFNSRQLLVTYYNRQGLVDKVGKVIVPPVYKQIQLQGNKTVALPFKKWTLYGEDSRSEQTFYFDNTIPIDEHNFAIQAHGHIGIINREEVYMAYLQNLELLDVQHGLLLVSNGQYEGVVNKDGKVVLPVNYDSVDIREEVIFAQIRRRDKQDWQAFNHQGVLQSNHRYESFFEVSKDRIGAIRNGKSGLLDNSGNEASPFLYDKVFPMTNRKAVVSYQGNMGIINDLGHWVITPYKDQLMLYDRYIFYKQGTQSGLLDFSGEVLYQTQKELHPTDNNFVISHDLDGYQVLNSLGELLTSNHYDSVYSIHSDMLALQENGKYFLFRPTTNDMLNTPENTEILGSFAEGAITAKIEGQWGFISEQGLLTIANRYEAVNPFSEGLAAVKLIGKWGVINRKEEIVIQPAYDSISPFYGGLSVVYARGQMGMMDKSGHPVLETRYDRIERHENYILISSAGLFGLADARGSLVRSPQFDSIETSDGTHFIVSKNGKFGVVSITGEDKVPVAFERIRSIGNGYLVAEPSAWTTPDYK